MVEKARLTGELVVVFLLYKVYEVPSRAVGEKGLAEGHQGQKR
jgi:hypothetical protein